MPDRRDDDEDQPTTSNADVRRAQAILSGLHIQRRDCVRARERGTLDEGQLIEWQALLLDATEACRPWRDRVGDRWDRAGPDWMAGFDGLHEHTGAVERESVETVGFGRVKRTTKMVPQVLPFETLLSLSRELEDIAEGIGLNAGPENDPDQLDGGVL
jgi:hypothetical protein